MASQFIIYTLIMIYKCTWLFQYLVFMSALLKSNWLHFFNRNKMSSFACTCVYLSVSVSICAWVYVCERVYVCVCVSVVRKQSSSPHLMVALGWIKFLLRIADMKSKNHLRNFVSKCVSLQFFVRAIIPKPLNWLTWNLVGMFLRILTCALST